MTLIQEAIEIMEKMPIKSQQVVVELLKLMSLNADSALAQNADTVQFKRTGKSKFNLPPDFDEHFDDMNDEIAAMFLGENV